MSPSARILVTLVTLPVIPILLLAGAIIGIAGGIKFTWLWLDFVWNDLNG